MTKDLHRPRPRRAPRLILLATGLVSLGLWTGVAGASDTAEATAAVAVDLPGWNGETVEGDAADLVARIGQAMDASVGVDDTGNRWGEVGDVGNRWTGTPRRVSWGNRWVGR